MLEGFVDNNGPFNPAAVIGEAYNMADQPQMATWPNVNRVNTQGSFKAPPLRNIELMAPFFHNGGKLTLRQVVDFYLRGGDFPKTNAAHRDFLIMNLANEDEALGGFSLEEKNKRITALVDFLLELTDDRVRFEQAPFDHPEVFVPLDGKAPDNTFSRPGLLAQSDGVPLANQVPCAGGGTPAVTCFKHVPAVGAGGHPATPVETFLNTVKGSRSNPNCHSAGGAAISHYCAEVD
jgi:hypothetical protein